jgi:hypothetical protein
VAGVKVSIGSQNYYSDAFTGYYTIPVSMGACQETHTIGATDASYNNFTDSVEVLSGVDVWKFVSMNPASACIDNDGDGYGNPGDASCANGSAVDCDGRPSGADGIAGNADDGGNISPGSDEVCDRVDNDCNSLIDDADPGVTNQPVWYPDTDGDTYGNPVSSVQVCVPPANYVLDNTDCDDSEEYIYPGGPEVRIVDPPTSYYWISELQTAYADAADGETIECKVATYDGTTYGNVTLDQNKSIIIQGGYDCSYSTITGTTTIQGNMTISNGGATIEDVELAP